MRCWIAALFWQSPCCKKRDTARWPFPLPRRWIARGLPGSFPISWWPGRVGRHALFISDEFGPAVRLASVLTDCPICAPEPLFVRQEGCGTCSACAKACPAGAISGREYIPGMPREDFFDAACCSNYMKKSFQMIGRGAVCGICMATCQNRWKEKFLKKP